MRIHVIVAVAQNGVIGGENKLLWRISEDLKRFKALTMGHPILMGRKTWESIGRPLPGRENVVISRQKLDLPGATVVHSLDAALEHARARGATDAFVIGGGEIYRQALPRADVVHLTEVHASFDGDVTFPSLPSSDWRETSREKRSKAEPQALSYDFVTYERRR